MTTKSREPPEKGLWAYAYDIVLPNTEAQLRTIQDLLDQEHTQATAGTRTWAGRVVIEPQVTRILVVSDSPEQDHEVNRRLAAALHQLEATFQMTIPLAVVDDRGLHLLNGDPLPKPS